MVQRHRMHDVPSQALSPVLLRPSDQDVTAGQRGMERSQLFLRVGIFRGVQLAPQVEHLQRAQRAQHAHVGGAAGGAVDERCACEGRRRQQSQACAACHATQARRLHFVCLE